MPYLTCSKILLRQGRTTLQIAETEIWRSLVIVKSELEECLWLETDRRWTERSADKGRSKRCLSWSGNSVRTVGDIHTGNFSLWEHAKWIGIVADDTCRGCSEEIEPESLGHCAFWPTDFALDQQRCCISGGEDEHRRNDQKMAVWRSATHMLRF